LRVTPWLVLASLAGCGTGEGASYIVLDPAARAALIESEADGHHHRGALPLEVEGNEVELIGPSGRLRLPVTARTVYQVDGWGTARQWMLGEEVRLDVVEVGGPEPAVRNLASALGARPPQLCSGRWRLEGPEVLTRLSWMGELPEISEVALVLTEEGRARARSETEGPTAALPTSPRPMRSDEGLEALVGIYTSDATTEAPRTTLFLNAEGGYVLEKMTRCELSRVEGTYRREGGGIRLYGTDLALTIGASGRLEAPGLVFSGGDE